MNQAEKKEVSFAQASNSAGLLYLLTFAIAFSQSVPLINIDGRNLHIGFDTIVIFIIIVCWAIRMLSKGKHIIVFDNASKWILILWFWNLVMLIVTIMKFSGAPRAVAVFVFLRWSQYIPLFFIVLNIDLSTKQIKNILLICGVAAFLTCVINIIEFFIVGLDYTTERGTTLAAKSFFIEDAQLNYNITAVYLMIVGLVLTPFIILSRTWKNLSIITFFLLLVTGIWLTSSRSALIGLLLGLIFLLIVYVRHGIAYTAIILLPIVMVAVYFLRDSFFVQNLLKLQYIYQALPMLMGEDMLSLGLPEIAGGGVHRLFLWGEAFRFFMNSPLWGNGFYTLEPLTSLTADNYYLEMLANTGLIGLMCFFLFVRRLFISSIQLHNSNRGNELLKKFSIGYQAAFVGAMFINLLGGMFMAQRIWGIFILFSAIVCNQLHALRKSERQKKNLRAIEE